MLRLLDCILPGFFQVFQLRFIHSHPLVALGIVCGVSLLHFFESDFFGCVIPGSDLVGALEGHVLHHVRQAGFTKRILGRAGIYMRVEGKHRRFGALQDDHSQPIGEFLDGNPLFEGGNILGGG